METGVTEVSDVTTNPDETVVQPPDDLVAKEVSAIVNYDSNKDKASRAKPSNLATTSISNTSRVHIQETRNKRFTPAQQQRQEIYKSMVALFEAENKKENLGMFQRRIILRTFCTDFARDFHLGQMLSPAHGYFLQLCLLDITLQARFRQM